MPCTKNASVTAANWDFSRRFARIGTLYLSKVSFPLVPWDGDQCRRLPATELVA